MKRNIILILLFFTFTLTAQYEEIINLKPITLNDNIYKDLEDKLSHSTFPATALKDSTFFIDTLVLDGYQYVDYTYIISYTSGWSKDNMFSFRIFYKNTKPLKIIFDTNLDYKLADEKVIDIDERKGKVEVFFKKFSLFYEYNILNEYSIINHQIGGIVLKPLYYFVGNFKIHKVPVCIVLQNEVTGVRVSTVESLETTAHQLSNERVMLTEPYLYQDKYYEYYDFNFKDLTLKIRERSSLKKPESYRKGYYVNRDVLKEKIGHEINNDKVLLYFWGVWCQPCIESFDETTHIYNEIKNQPNIQMWFFSYNINGSNIEKTKQFLQEKELSTNQIHLFSKNEAILMSEFISYKSITSLLKIHNYPTYVLIDDDGKILYRDTKITEELYSLLLEE